LRSEHEPATAPALEEYLHGVVPRDRSPESFLCLLDHPTLRRFTAVVGTTTWDGAMRDLAARKGKRPYEANEFVFDP
jgi:hypothetical protein